MAVTAEFAESFIIDVFNGAHDLASGSPDVIKIGLLDTTYTFDPEVDTDWDGVGGLGTDHEITSAGGYAAITVTDISVAAGAGSGVIEITTAMATQPTWTATGAAMDSTIGACLYNNSTTPKKIIMVIDFDGTYLTAEDKLFRVDLSNGIATATITII